MDKIALVTGGSSGIGFESAKALVKIGYTVIIVARNAQKLNEAVSTFDTDKVIGIAADVTIEKDVIRLFSEVEKKYGRLDFLFNNAGVGSPAQPIEDVSFDEWKRVCAINIDGCFLCAREAVRLMKKTKSNGWADYQ